MDATRELLVDLGLGSLHMRAIFGGVLGLLPLLFKIPISYYDAGAGIKLAKEFAPFAAEGTPEERKTYIHAFMWPFIGAGLLTVFL